MSHALTSRVHNSLGCRPRRRAYWHLIQSSLSKLTRLSASFACGPRVVASRHVEIKTPCHCQRHVRRAGPVIKKEGRVECK